MSTTTGTTTDTGTTGTTTAVGAAGAEAVQHSRMWLSVRERTAAATWCTFGAGWSWMVANVHPPVGISAVTLLAGSAWPSYVWWTSRRVRPAQEDAPTTLSADAQALIDAWPHTIAVGGPVPLQGSRIVAESMTEPAPGAYAFAVELGEHVHAEDAVSDTIRRHLERALRLPVGTAALRVDRDDCARILLTFTPARHLEVADATWAGPVLREDGSVPLAVTPAGDDVAVGLFNADGVEGFVIVGTSGVGKSVTSGAVLLPGVMARHEVLWVVDGGRGTSAAHLAGAADWWAVDPAEGVTAIRAAHAVLLARKTRRAAAGLSSWRVGREKEAILTLWIDEAKSFLAGLTKSEAAELAMKVAEIAREGRKLGIRLGQGLHSPMGTDCLGGRQTRALLGGNGSVIAHRPGDATDSMLATGSTDEAVDLRSLPAGPGWVVVIRRGAVLSTACRVRHADEDTVRDLLAAFTPRTLDGADAAAADSYAGRTRGTVARDRYRALQNDEAVPADVEEHGDVEHQGDEDGAVVPAPRASLRVVPEAGTATPLVLDKDDDDARRLNATAREAAATAEANRAAVLATLAGGPLSRAELIEGCGLARTTAARAITALAAAGVITRGEDLRWRLAGSGA